MANHLYADIPESVAAHGCKRCRQFKLLDFATIEKSHLADFSQAFVERYRRNVLYKRLALAFKHSHSKHLHGIGLSSNLHRLRNIERAVELAHHVVADCTVGIVIITYAVYIRMVCAFYKHLRLIPPGSVIGIGASFWHVHCGAARICLVLYAGDFRQRGRNGRRCRKSPAFL